MSLPRLNRRLTLEDPARVPDGAGGYTASWTALGVHWGQIVSRPGRERAEGGAAMSATACRIIVRAAPAGHPSRPRPEQRFRDGNRVFTIRAVTEHDMAGMYLTCHSDEEVVA